MSFRRRSTLYIVMAACGLIGLVGGRPSFAQSGPIPSIREAGFADPTSKQGHRATLFFGEGARAWPATRAEGRSFAGRAVDLLVPGRAQLRRGERARGTVLAVSALTAVTGLGVTHWLYGRKVDLANSYEDEYQRSIATLAPLAAYMDSEGYLTQTPLYRDWTDAYESAKDRRSIRNVAALVVGAVYVAHALDLVLPLGQGDDAGATALTVRPMITTPDGGAGVSATVKF